MTAVATLLLLIGLALPWFSLVSFGMGVGGLSVSALDAHSWTYLALLVALAILAYLVVRALVTSVRLPLPHWQLLVGVTGLNLILTVICFLAKPRGYSWSFGAYLGLVAAVVALVGAVLRRTDPETLPAHPATAQFAPVAGSPMWPVSGPPVQQSVSPPVVSPSMVAEVSAAPPVPAAPATSTPSDVVAAEPATTSRPSDVAPRSTAEPAVAGDCPRCGRSNPADNRFCYACGEALGAVGGTAMPDRQA